MKKLEISPLDSQDFEMITMGTNQAMYLTLKSMNPLDLPNFLRDLSPITHNSLSTIIYDIIEENPNEEFTLTELRQHVFTHMNRAQYDLAASTKSTIKRALNSISLKI